MPEYRVVWEIDVEADSPAAAAEEAAALMAGEDTTATCFTVVADDGRLFEFDLLFDQQRTRVIGPDGQVTFYLL